MYWNREIWKFLWWKKHAYESSSSYFNPESAIKNNRKDFLNQLIQFTTLRQFMAIAYDNCYDISFSLKKRKSDDAIKYASFYSK